MGCAGSKDSQYKEPNEDKLAKAANHVIGSGVDRSIKLLLLGSGSSGKTTFRKQLRNIFVGFDENQRVESAMIIMENLWLGAKTLVTALHAKQILLDNKDCAIILAQKETDFNLNDQTAKAIQNLWKAPQTQELIASKPEDLQLQECVNKFMEELANYPTWGGPKWIPSVDDCIRARVRSSGVAEEHFTIEGTTFKLFDAGGQRSERRKWIHYFDSVNSVLFMTSLTAYSETIFEDSNQNGLVEALELFENISNSKFFRSTPFMLFFNKKDLFEEYFLKLKIPLNRSGNFPDAPEDFNLEAAIKWQVDMFKARKKVDPDSPNDLNIYTHVTTAVSKDNVDRVFATCRTIILKDSLTKSGFVPT